MSLAHLYIRWQTELGTGWGSCRSLWPVLTPLDCGLGAHESTNLGIHPYMRKCLWMYKFLEEFRNSIWAKIYTFKCIGVKRKSLTLWPLPMATQLKAKWDFKAVTSLAGNGGADEWILGFPSCVECCQRHTFLTHTIYCSKSGVSREEGGDWESSSWDTPRTLLLSRYARVRLCVTP